jgi:L-alanine-DL-glutamate epimerase-like enolase superfamily enzyme
MMRITRIEDLHADCGWRTLSFLKISTDAGIVGYAECAEGMGGPGMIQVIRRMAQSLIGLDPRNVGAIGSRLYLGHQMTQGGMIAQAIGAIENACLDIKGKAVGLPVYDLYGGRQRDSLQTYWSHCGTYRVRSNGLFEDKNGSPPIRSLSDLTALGKEVLAKGYRALKTNLLLFDGDRPRQYRPAFVGGPGSPELNISPALLRAAEAQMGTFRDAVGPDVALMLDLNTHYKTEGLRRMAKVLEPFDLTWLEVDVYNPAALAALRQWTALPIGSLETIYGRRQIKPFLDAEAVDVCIVDPLWQGFPEAMKIANLAETYEVNVAAHNSHGYHATIMGAHMSAAIPNFRYMEFDVDEVPWMKDFFTCSPVVEDGQMKLPDGPGWGCDVVEEAVLAHPPKNGDKAPWLLDWHRAQGAAV